MGQKETALAVGVGLGVVILLAASKGRGRGGAGPGGGGARDLDDPLADEFDDDEELVDDSEEYDDLLEPMSDEDVRRSREDARRERQRGYVPPRAVVIPGEPTLVKPGDEKPEIWVDSPKLTSPDAPEKIAPRAAPALPRPSQDAQQAYQAAMRAEEQERRSAARPAPRAPAPAPRGAPAPAPRRAPAPAPRAPAPALPAGYDAAKARKMAGQVANHLRNAGRSGYSRPMLREFQRAAGIVVDGLYGGGTRGALVYYGAKTPPTPYFASRTTGTRTLTYTPPEER